MAFSIYITGFQRGVTPMGDADKELVVTFSELYDLYSTLSDATTAASTGDPNTVSKKAAEAKDMVLDIHDAAEQRGQKFKHVGAGNGDYQKVGDP